MQEYKIHNKTSIHRLHTNVAVAVRDTAYYLERLTWREQLQPLHGSKVRSVLCVETRETHAFTLQ